jgi:rhodanese-related sulfurtransferase
MCSKPVTKEEVPRITKEELKPLLNSPDVVVVDVRSGRDWKATELKIKGAVRGDPDEIESWSVKYDKSKNLILYCA